MSNSPLLPASLMPFYNYCRKMKEIKIDSTLSDSDLIALVKLTTLRYNQVYEDEGRAADALSPLKERLHALYAEIVRRIEQQPSSPTVSALILALYDWIYDRNDWSGRDKERMEQFLHLTKRLLERNQKLAFLTEIQCLQHKISIYALLTKEERKELEAQIDETFQRWMQTHEWGQGWSGCTTAETLKRLEVRLNTTAFSVTRDWDYEFTDVMESSMNHIDPDKQTDETLTLWYDVAVGMEEWYLPLTNDLTETTAAIIEAMKRRIALKPDLQQLSRVTDWQIWQEQLFV